MKRRMQHGLATVFLSLACSLISITPAFAAEVKGSLEEATSGKISGWAYDSDTPTESVDVNLYYYADGSTTATKFATVKADQYRDDLEQQTGSGNGNHGFTYTVDWDRFQGDTFVVEACVVVGGKKERISDPIRYTKGDLAKTSSGEEFGPGMSKQPEEPEAPAAEKPKGDSLGIFTTTAYCSCSTCSSGHNLTYSGTVPKAGHTISADINIFPINTKLRIGDTVYTVEDIGSGVNGNKLDIFFNSHAEALNYGMKKVEVFAVSE